MRCRRVRFGRVLNLRCGRRRKQATEVDGTWNLVGFNVGGKDDAKTVAEKFVITRKDGLQTITKGGVSSDKSNFKIDASAKPKTITFTWVEDDKTTTAGIYVVEGDTMKIAVFNDKSKQATDRPKDFEPAEGKTVATYKKAK